MSVVVVGSGNVDLVSRVQRIPSPGETVLATGFAQHPGGKGNNQATAAARAGAQTVFVGAFGDDANGALLHDSLMDSGVHAHVRLSREPTGTAMISVSEAGENAIVVNAGANATLVDLDEGEQQALRDASVALLQLEVPLATVSEAAEIAVDAETLVVLNAAPAAELPDALLACVDVLVVNEHEAALLAGGSEVGDAEAGGGEPGNAGAVAVAAAGDPESHAKTLLAHVRAVVVTLGGDGALLATRGADAVRIPGQRVAVVDTTGAGDTFCGALVARLDELGASDPAALADACRFATRAAALSVQREGAVPSIPTREEIDRAGR